MHAKISSVFVINDIFVLAQISWHILQNSDGLFIILYCEMLIHNTKLLLL